MSPQQRSLYCPRSYPLPSLPNLVITHTPALRRPANALPMFASYASSSSNSTSTRNFSMSSFFGPPASWFPPTDDAPAASSNADSVLRDHPSHSPTPRSKTDQAFDRLGSGRAPGLTALSTLTSSLAVQRNGHPEEVSVGHVENQVPLANSTTSEPQKIKTTGRVEELSTTASLPNVEAKGLPAKLPRNATTPELPEPPAKQHSTVGDEIPADDTVPQHTKALAKPPSRQRSKRGRAQAQPIDKISSSAECPSPECPSPAQQPAADEGSDPQNKGRATAAVSGDPKYEGVFGIERLLCKQWSGKVLWLKIKWKGLANGSWEKADFMKEELGEEDYQELLETLPRKRRKKAAKW